LLVLGLLSTQPVSQFMELLFFIVLGYYCLLGLGYLGHAHTWQKTDMPQAFTQRFRPKFVPPSLPQSTL
jgi:hypothetical protein